MQVKKFSFNSERNSNSLNKVPNLNVLRLKSSQIHIEKEKLYDDNICLKESVNNLNKVLVNLKSENYKKELEISKKDKLLENIINSNGLINEELLSPKKLENGLFANLKKQYKHLKFALQEKNLENENLKKKLKNTKINEIQIETEIFNEEMKKLKLKIEYLQSIKCDCSETINKQNKTMIYLQELITSLQDEKVNFIDQIMNKNETEIK